MTSVLLEVDAEFIRGLQRSRLGMETFSTKLSEDGIDIDDGYGAIPLAGGSRPLSLDPPATVGPFLLRADLKGSPAQIDCAQIKTTLRARSKGTVRAVWSDPPIRPFPSGASAGQRADAAEVERLLGVGKVWEACGHRGKDVGIAILDSGIDASEFNVTCGWSPTQTRPGAPSIGAGWENHGNMCAFAARIACPEAEFHDYGVGRIITPFPTLISTAIKALSILRSRYLEHGKPQVVSISWGMKGRSMETFARGSPCNYADNPRHPLMQQVDKLIDAGVLVVACAGNCGGTLPDDGCDLGAAQTDRILGLSGYEPVITVGAVDCTDGILPYSSQGPSSMDTRKPDVCGYSEFKGFNDGNSGGTSTSAPLVAGVLALLRSIRSDLDQKTARELLRLTSGRSTWDQLRGYGTVNAFAAYERLRS